MDTRFAILLGIISGLVGCALPVRFIERVWRGGRTQDNGIFEGLMAIVVSFVLMSLCILAVYVISQEEHHLLAFGCSMVGTFLVVLVVETVRVMHVSR